MNLRHQSLGLETGLTISSANTDGLHVRIMFTQGLYSQSGEGLRTDTSKTMIDVIYKETHVSLCVCGRGGHPGGERRRHIQTQEIKDFRYVMYDNLLFLESSCVGSRRV